MIYILQTLSLNFVLCKYNVFMLLFNNTLTCHHQNIFLITIVLVIFFNNLTVHDWIINNIKKINLL